MAIRHTKSEDRERYAYYSPPTWCMVSLSIASEMVSNTLIEDLSISRLRLMVIFEKIIDANSPLRKESIREEHIPDCDMDL